ncbi:MAG TPA: hypothetical protein VFU15_09695 [Bacteroidia bacterium]|nr:hypothetical protein [Bacteroidia bacterium]
MKAPLPFHRRFARVLVKATTPELLIFAFSMMTIFALVVAIFFGLRS